MFSSDSPSLRGTLSESSVCARTVLAISIALMLGGLAAAAAHAQPGGQVQHRLSVGVEPQRHLLRVSDVISLPPAETEESIEFLLNAALEVRSSDPAVERVPLGDVEGFFGLNGSSVELSEELELARYRLARPPPEGTLTLSYRGEFDFGLSAQKEEYTRGFRDTVGIVGEEGVYLAGSGFWYPYFGDELVEFEMVVDVPEGWHLISQGGGVSRDPEGKAGWISGGPMDEIYLVGGPLVLYEQAAGAVTAQVYLHEPDAALAARYLTATAQYLEMYRKLIGPYPYDKFALVENFWETGYGMPSFTLLGPTVIRFPFILTSSYPHEILHNWWGNSVFVDFSTGNWSEGLTAYLADHLLQEQRGKAEEHRRATLQKYRNYVKEGRDFPLVEFRSRHSAATEAVGYGKTLMGFHMLRLHVGDGVFRDGLATFYRRYRGRRASFADLRTVFEEVGGEDLGWFFQPWVERAGAAALEVSAEVAQTSEGWTVRGALRQVQPLEPFELEVPIVLQTADAAVSHRARVVDRETPFELVVQEPPLALHVDPRFDVFRLLDAREIPPSLGQIFGDAEIVALLPSGADSAALDAYRQLVEAWQSDSHSIVVALDRDVEVPVDRSVWVMGRENLHAERLFGTGLRGLEVGSTEVVLAGESVPWIDHSLVVTRRHPHDRELAAGWLVVEPLAAAAGMARKLPHYGKYSYLAFEGDEPTNVVKGQWPTGDSPLTVDLRPAGQGRAVLLPPLAPESRAALVELPPVFSERRLMEHVEYLASEELEGRGVGSEGLEKAADYIAGRFEAAGLEPGGEQGSFFQRFRLAAGPEGSPVELANVVGVLRGSRDEWRDQAVVVSAHYDHLGRGWPDVHRGDAGQIHPGADDNASGVAVLLELAATLAQGERPQRSLVFVAFSAEEAGRAGSQHFVAHPAGFSLEQLRAVINLDTVGRLEGRPVTILGAGTATEWPHIFRGASYVTGVESRSVAESVEASDQMSFIARGVPGVQLFTQAHADYHRPGDTAGGIDSAGLVGVATLVKEAVDYLAAREQPLTVTIEEAGAEGDTGAPSSGRKVRFGTVPDFAFEGPGVRIEKVSAGSPAEAAGVLDGDVLIRIDGEEVTDLRAYSRILRTLEPGQTVRATVLRDGQEMTLEVTAEAR